MLTEYEIALQSQANFTINVLNQIVTSNEGVAFSPYSLTLALAMCFIGAGGKTEIEFKNLLSPNVDKTKYFEFFEDSINNINFSSTKQIQISRLKYYIYEKTSIFRAPARFELMEYLKSKLKHARIGDSKTAAKMINDILKQIVEDKLNDIITPDDINLSTIGDNINIANKLFIQKNYPIKEEYIKNMEKYLKATFENVDYNAPITAAKTINDFVEKFTHGKINNIIDPTSIDSSTKAVLVNALYFKSQWLEKFDKELTNDTENKISRNELSTKIKYLEKKM